MDSGHEAKIEIMVNDRVIAHLHDRNHGSSNKRFAMVSQSVMQRLNVDDQVAVRLHKGALAGGTPSFTSFLGFLMDVPEQNEI